MAWITGESCWLCLPAPTDVFIGGESFERFESLSELISHQKGLQVFFQVVGLIVILVHGGVFAGAVHPFYLAIGPGLVGLGQPMVDAILMTDAIEDMLKGIAITPPVRELEAIIGQHGVDLVWYGGNQVLKELRGHHFVGLFMQLGIGQFAGTVNGDKQGGLAFFRSDLRRIDREVTNRGGLELLLCGLLAGRVR
jgi:hypothetical protein